VKSQNGVIYFAVNGLTRFSPQQNATKHGPFFYLNRCFAKGQMQSLLLKTPDQVAQARQSLAAYTQVQARLDQISQINHELLRRGQLLVGEVS
jgi:histone acetyltransferase (RNA polymerase elongator complex component)